MRVEQALIDRCAALYKEGKSIGEIADAVKHFPASVSYYLKLAGVERKPKKISKFNFAVLITKQCAQPEFFKTHDKSRWGFVYQERHKEEFAKMYDHYNETGMLKFVEPTSYKSINKV